ncbi:hypothetical protein RAP19_07660 [Campylobacter jejuni]|uniref:hypothetical protein n=1 Tax=Campylobacter jejuni TaxID=197 RepID=UPI00127B338A|nr:hypothetical protein [Campylobacter jejuni]ECP8682680.1 hypothetical protein [Campylobacter jejuni]EDP5186865.1 hypothetical protein [Campylobacter jejuni]MDP8419042.1 hypothetical protein [Campylobacter jejuni]MDP8477492.1 hypothetical protein [Campylobacter jejuni]
MLSLILDMDIDYFIIILFLMALVNLAIIMTKRHGENMNFKTTLILICLVFVWCFTFYKLYSFFSYETNSAKKEAVQNYIQTIENKIDPRFKDKIKEQFSSIPNTFGFNLCYENNYTGETCLNYLFYFENKVKDEVKKAREEFVKARDINNNINDKFNKGEENESRN